MSKRSQVKVLAKSNQSELKRLYLLSLTGILVLAALLFSSFAKAEEAEDKSDMIVFSLSEEAWVEAEKPLVRINMNLGFAGKDTGTARSDILSALKKLDGAAKWRITNINRSQDRSGLESWNVNAEARVGEASLSGLTSRAEKASRPGFNIRVSNIDWSPSHAEREQARSDLRKKLYERAKQELANAKMAFPEKAYTIGMMNLGQNGPVAMPARYAKSERVMMAMDAAPAPQSGGGLGVTEHMVMNAVVVLEAASNDK